MSPAVVEVRCPVGPQRLFTKLRLGEESARYLESANLIEFSCSDCSRRKAEPTRIFHRYNFIGELVETVAVPKL